MKSQNYQWLTLRRVEKALERAAWICGARIRRRPIIEFGKPWREKTNTHISKKSRKISTFEERKPVSCKSLRVAWVSSCVIFVLFFFVSFYFVDILGEALSLASWKRNFTRSDRARLLWVRQRNVWSKDASFVIVAASNTRLHSLSVSFVYHLIGNVGQRDTVVVQRRILPSKLCWQPRKTKKNRGRAHSFVCFVNEV